MNIEEIGGEFALIDRLSAIVPQDHADLVLGVGDDAAVIRTSPEPAPYLLVTTDILVENRHFKRQWARPEQIGIKAAECNISDIAAMGGRPTWMFISLVIEKQTEAQWVESLYAGISASCRRHGVIVAGGDTTLGSVNTINITQLGAVSPASLCLRSHARTGDRLMVTGPLGGSAAALALLEQSKSPSPYLLEKHITPKCRLDVVETIAPLAHAMIDISDGLGSEVRHICNQSKVGAKILADAVPLHDDVREAGLDLGVNPLDWALSGGEDFELLFSIAPGNIPDLEKSGLKCFAVGTVTADQGDVSLVNDNGEQPLHGGFDHFTSP